MTFLISSIVGPMVFSSLYAGIVITTFISLQGTAPYLYFMVTLKTFA
jgi:hypothetical protein